MRTVFVAEKRHLAEERTVAQHDEPRLDALRVGEKDLYLASPNKVHLVPRSPYETATEQPNKSSRARSGRARATIRSGGRMYTEMDRWDTTSSYART